MEEKDLFKKIKKESGDNVPDVYKKVVSEAEARGLLNVDGGTAEVYSDGETVAAGGVSRKAIAITALVGVAGVCLAIALPLALVKTGGMPDVPPIDPIPEITLELGNDYAIGAVSTAKLLGSFIDESSAQTMKTKTALHSVSESELTVYKKYFNAYDTFFGEIMADPVKVPSADSKYANSVKITGERANGDDVNYNMYYTEAMVVDDTAAEGDPVKYYIEGVISVGYGQMLLLGERTVPAGGKEGEETLLNISAYPNENNKNTYVKMELERSVEGNKKIDKYNYSVVVNGHNAGGAVMYRPAQHDNGANIAFALDILGIGDVEDVSYNVFRPAKGEDLFQVNYETKLDRGSFSVAIIESGYEFVLSDLFVYKLIGDGTCEITGYDKNKTLPKTLVIPSSYDGNRVLSIGSSAFSYCNSIDRVYIPEGVEKINSSAFYSCSVKEVHLPLTLREIGNEAFRICKNLISVSLPEGLETIKSTAFKDCINLKSLHIPASVKYLDDNIIDKGIMTSLTVAEGNIAYIGNGNCIIEKSSKTLIYGCTNSTIPSDGSVEIIGRYAFEGCHFASIEIPEGITEIQTGAFQECGKLQEISLPESLETIETSVFANCKSLCGLNIPAGVIHMYSGFTQGCDSLAIVTVDDANVFYKSSGNCIIDKYRNILIAGCKESVIPDDGSVEIIDAWAFAYLTSLTKIEIPSSVSKIGVGAFEYSGLTSIEIPDSVVELEGSAFEGCENLKTVKLSANLKLLDVGVLRGCLNLNNVIIPDSVEIIETGAFQNCVILTNLVLSANIKKIGSQAFEGSGLTQFEVPSGITEIEESCFKWNSDLNSVTISASVTAIGAQAFYGCLALKEIKYEGTLDEWNAIDKGQGWYYNVIGCVVRCSDGQTVELNWYDQFE